MPVIRNDEYWKKLQEFLLEFKKNQGIFVQEIQRIINDDDEYSIEKVEEKIKNKTLDFIEKIKNLSFSHTDLVDEELDYTEFKEESSFFFNTIDGDKVSSQKQIDNEILKQVKEALGNFDNLKKITEENISDEYSAVEEYVISIIDNESKAKLILCELGAICENIKVHKKRLQDSIDNAIDNSGITVEKIQNSILSQTKNFIENLKSMNLDKIIARIENNLLKEDIIVDADNQLISKEQKQNYQILKKYYENVIKDSEQLDFNYEKTKEDPLDDIGGDVIRLFGNEDERFAKIMGSYETSESKVQFFINNSIISPVQKHEIMRKLSLELERKEDTIWYKNTLTNKIKSYFEQKQNYFIKPYNQHLDEYHASTNTIDSEFEKEYESLKLAPDSSDDTKTTKLKELNDNYKTKRKQKFENFQEEINNSLPNINFILDDSSEFNVYKKAMLLNENLTFEEKEKFLATINELTSIHLKINHYKKENANIQDKKSPIYNAIDEAESVKTNNILENVYPNITKTEKGSWLNSNSDPIKDKIIKPLVYLEENLKIDNELAKLDNYIKEWVDSIIQVRSAKASWEWIFKKRSEM